jgi:amino acid transporter
MRCFCSFGFLSYMSAGSTTAGQVFGYFAALTSVCGLISWAAICWTYIRFYNGRSFIDYETQSSEPRHISFIGMKAQGIDRSTLPYRAPLQPYAAYYALTVRISSCHLQIYSHTPLKHSPQISLCLQFILVILFFNGFSVFIDGQFDVAVLITSYLPIVVFPMMYFGYRFLRPVVTLPAAELDFFGGTRDVTFSAS